MSIYLYSCVIKVRHETSKTSQQLVLPASPVHALFIAGAFTLEPVADEPSVTNTLVRGGGVDARRVTGAVMEPNSL